MSILHISTYHYSSPSSGSFFSLLCAKMNENILWFCVMLSSLGAWLVPTMLGGSLPSIGERMWVLETLRQVLRMWVLEALSQSKSRSWLNTWHQGQSRIVMAGLTESKLRVNSCDTTVTFDRSKRRRGRRVTLIDACCDRKNFSADLLPSIMAKAFVCLSARKFVSWKDVSLNFKTPQPKHIGPKCKEIGPNYNEIYLHAISCWYHISLKLVWARWLMPVPVLAGRDILALLRCGFHPSSC